MNSYKALTLWQDIMALLPEHNQIDEFSEPKEIIWHWKNHKIHLDHYVNESAKMKIIALHGVGGNGRLLSMINVPLFKSGIEVIAPDLPGYGITEVNGKTIDFNMWVNLVSDLIDTELERDDRPILLLGLSAGGMLAYHVAALNKKVSGIVASNLLDQRIPEVLRYSAVHPWMAKWGTKFMKPLSRVMPGLKIPMKFVANTKKIVNDAGLLRILIKDKHSAGASVPIVFLVTLIEAVPMIEPEVFDLCPVLLLHPEIDHWTPVHLSQLFYDQLKCDKDLIMLENAGHFPIEQPGLIQLEKEIVRFVNGIIK